MATLGQKLRELRHQRGFKLNEVAEGADLSISFISLIERDKASISVENLQKLANFYNVRLFQIFQDIEEEDAFIVRKSQMEQLGEYSNPALPFLYLLSPEDNLSFKSILVYIPPAAYHESVQIQKGEAFLLVKEGTLKVDLPNKKPILLHEGDSAHLTSFKGTVLSSANDNKAVKLFVVASATVQHLDRQGDLLSYQGVE